MENQEIDLKSPVLKQEETSWDNLYVEEQANAKNFKMLCKLFAYLGIGVLFCLVGIFFLN